MRTRLLYLLYCSMYRAKLWQRRHINPAGILVMSGILLSIMFGLNITKTSVYQLTVLFLILILFSAINNFIPFRPKINVERRLGRYAVAKEAWIYSIEITNLTDRCQKGLFLYEMLEDPRPDWNTFLNTREPYEKLRNPWDRGILYYRWHWLIKKNEKIKLNRISLPDMQPGETIIVKNRARPEGRGYLRFSGISILRPDILGLFHRVHRVTLKDKVLILPQITRVTPVSLASNRHFHPGGLSLASSTGDSDEFMSLRPYRPGDPMRNVHWRSFAKTSELVIKEFEDEHFVRHALVFDISSRPENEIGFEKSVSLAASYTMMLQGPESILDLLIAGGKTYSFSSGRGLGQPSKMLEVLACVTPDCEHPVSNLIPVLGNRLKQFSGSICIFQDWHVDHAEIYHLFKRAGINAVFIVVTVNPDQIKEKIERSKVDQDNIEVVAV